MNKDFTHSYEGGWESSIGDLSIVIASYNQQEFLPEAIQSALDQTVSCEIIVVNDGSTDKSLEIAKRFPVKVINQVNKGLPSARNTGIMNATRKYVLFLDADDILQDKCAERILEYAEKTDADVISPSFKSFGIENQVYELIPEPKLEDFKIGNRIGTCTAVKLSVLKEVGGYSPRMVFGYEDLALWINLLRIGKKFITIPEPLWLYRTRSDSMISESVKHHEELMAQIRFDNPNTI